MAAHNVSFEDARDVEGGVGIAPSPAVFDFLQQLLGAQPGGALVNTPAPSTATSIGIGRPPVVPRGIQSRPLPSPNPPPGTPGPPTPEVTSRELSPPSPALAGGPVPSSPSTGSPGLIGGEGLDIPPQQETGVDNNALLQAIMQLLAPEPETGQALQERQRAIRERRQRPFG